MPENKNTLDQHFKKQLTDLEVKPDPVVWYNIRTKSTAVAEKKGGMIRPFIQRYGAVAASVVLGIGMVTWMLNPNQFGIKPPVSLHTDIMMDVPETTPVHEPESMVALQNAPITAPEITPMSAITGQKPSPQTVNVKPSQTPKATQPKALPKAQKTQELPAVGTKTVALASTNGGDEGSFINSLLPRISISIDSDAEPETVNPPASVVEERPTARRYDSPVAFFQAKVRDQLGITKQVDTENRREVIEWNNPFFKVRHTRKIQQEKP